MSAEGECDCFASLDGVAVDDKHTPYALPLNPAFDPQMQRTLSFSDSSAAT